MRSVFCLAVCAAALSACVEPDVTISGFDKPAAGGRPNVTVSAYEWGQHTSGVTGNRYAYEVGPTLYDKFGAYAGISGTPSVTPPPTSGVVVMTGTYEAAYMFGINSTFASASGFAGETTGPMVVTVDYGTGSLQGSSTSGLLSVNGNFSGTSLTGTATFDGLAGPMEGLVGGDEAIAVFHGQSDSKIHAGGFIVHP